MHAIPDITCPQPGLRPTSVAHSKTPHAQMTEAEIHGGDSLHRGHTAHHRNNAMLPDACSITFF